MMASAGSPCQFLLPSRVSIDPMERLEVLVRPGRWVVSGGEEDSDIMMRSYRSLKKLALATIVGGMLAVGWVRNVYATDLAAARACQAGQPPVANPHGCDRSRYE